MSTFLCVTAPCKVMIISEMLLLVTQVWILSFFFNLTGTIFKMYGQ